MTYSRYKFLPIEVTNYTAGARPYRLMKFVDARDPRNVHLWEGGSIGEKQSDPHDDGTKVHRLSDNWCLLPQSNYTVENEIFAMAPYPNPGHPVLFIPGHWGEYRQARSLGAHGTTFTRRSHSYQYQNDVVRGLKDGTLNGKVEGDGDGNGDINHFIYDVYTADFDGEGSGLHGSRMVRQAYFVAQSILTIAKACNAESITVVGHSIGGIVAKAVPLLSPEARQYIKTIVTLASPHRGFPYSFDSSVQRFYNYIDEWNIKERKEAPTIISISGGLRDELIPPSTCAIDPSLGLAMLAKDIMPASSAEGTMADVSLGCDHKAISWCHNVLSVVRTMIFAAADVENFFYKVETRVDHVRNFSKIQFDDYAEALQAEERSFSDTYGFGKAAAIQATMPYRAWEFVVLYFMVATIQTVHSIVSGRINILRTCKYIVFLPMPLSSMFVRMVSLKWSAFVTTTALSTGSCLLYAVVLHGILPLLSGLYELVHVRGGGKKQRQSNRILSKEQCWTNHVYTTLTSVAFAAASMYLYHAAKRHPTALNLRATKAVFFWAIILNTFPRLVWSSIRTSNRVSKLVAALFLPVLPFVLAGKLTYALSMVSVGGQLDDEIFSNFEQGFHS
jgi:pimeloyl-ACP methyl ester carboxylesterase